MFETSSASASSRTSSRRALLFLFAALCVCLASAGASAQAARTGVSGRVLDQNGAAVPGARVRLRQASTGVEFNAEADDAGAYRFEDLAPGAYTRSASGEGFDRMVRAFEDLYLSQLEMPRGVSSRAA